MHPSRRIPQGQNSGSNQSNISYRPGQLSDLEILMGIHNDVFPIRSEFSSFRDALIGYNVLSWVAVDEEQSNGEDDQIIGFVSARIIPAKGSEIVDLLISNSSESEQSAIFILMLGVVEAYRKLGIATCLIHKVLNHARKVPACCAVYLHVASYNIPAIQLYKKLSFKCMQTLKSYYDIDGRHDDAHLFVHFNQHSEIVLRYMIIASLFSRHPVRVRTDRAAKGSRYMMLVMNNVTQVLNKFNLGRLIFGKWNQSPDGGKREIQRA